MKLLPKSLLSEVIKETGIYRLFSPSKQLIYIGRTISFARRLKEHDLSKEFEFFTIERRDVGLANIEKMYLEEYKERYGGELPVLNKKIG